MSEDDVLVIRAEVREERYFELDRALWADDLPDLHDVEALRRFLQEELVDEGTPGEWLSTEVVVAFADGT